MEFETIPSEDVVQVEARLHPSFHQIDLDAILGRRSILKPQPSLEPVQEPAHVPELEISLEPEPAQVPELEISLEPEPEPKLEPEPEIVGDE